MKLIKVKLFNFRQFYGSQTIVFSQDPKKNVTLVHAENGVGKTTLLNAIRWCFYGEVTSKFEAKDQIMNFEAVAENSSLASVEVTFEHEGKTYIVERHFSVRNGNGSRPDISLTAHEADRHGQLRQIDTPDTFVSSVVPRAMAKYFFFDGEHAETFSSETNARAVGQAVRDMLGCNVIEAAIEDLDYAAKQYGAQLADIPGEAQLSEFAARIKDLEDKLQRAQDNAAGKTAEKERLDDQIQEITDQLRDAEGAKHIQRARDDKERSLRSVQDRLRTAEQNVVKWVGTKTLPLVSRKLAVETLSFIDEESLKGRIPSPYNEEFVQGLLKAEVCICGHELKPATTEWKSVADLLRKASNSELMGRVVRARTRIGVLKELREDVPTVLENEQRKIGSLVAEQKDLEKEIGELGNQLKGLPLSEIAERERAREQLSAKRDAVIGGLGGVLLAVRQCERAIRDTRAEQDKITVKSERAKKLLGRREIAQQGGDILRSILIQHQEDAKITIEKLINNILEKTARRNYKFRFQNNFGMDLTYADGHAVPKSEGENQLMSLAFIAALVQFSLSRTEEAGGPFFIPGTIAPLVLDSPFGKLDQKYKSDTAHFVPKMASQVVLLLSSSQGDDAVMDVLKPFVGAEYVLVSENRGPRGEKTEDELVLRGKKIPTSLFNQPKNLTCIVEVK